MRKFRKNISTEMIEQFIEMDKSGNDTIDISYATKIYPTSIRYYVRAIEEITKNGYIVSDSIINNVSLSAVGEYCKKHGIHFPPYYDATQKQVEDTNQVQIDESSKAKADCAIDDCIHNSLSNIESSIQELVVLVRKQEIYIEKLLEVWQEDSGDDSYIKKLNETFGRHNEYETF